ncbi:MAG: WecB/TagA/CpsF family glycosyltransferase [Scytonematopsis contorta HA4267-MV1]|jgi:exopolysaccharide biosynthesis WecB/TagA/CpsF family protein|nr:WecB/TagA/CpsF family glycosyltransferase [Scytonematopsis contorta HA4267-MV1]
MKKVDLLNIAIDNISTVELLNKLKEGGIVFTPNVDHLIKLQKDENFYQVYNSATYKVCDSQILMYASNFLNTPIKEKISGSDLLPAFYQYYKHDQQMKIFLLGAAPGVAQKAQEKINRQVGRNMIVSVYSPSFGFENNEQECEEIIGKINDSGATVLAIGVGAPKQEKWIYKYKDKLPQVKVFLAVGASLDFEAQQKKRAPKWMSEVGLEWFYRLSSEPKRLWKRYLLDSIPFFWLILLQKLQAYKEPFVFRDSNTAFKYTKKNKNLVLINPDDIFAEKIPIAQVEEDEIQTAIGNIRQK